jgi:hypothetical protein
MIADGNRELAALDLGPALRGAASLVVTQLAA